MANVADKEAPYVYRVNGVSFCCCGGCSEAKMLAGE